MTDINRLIASLKRRSAHVKEFGDSITFVKLKDIDALVEALEKAQRANAAQDDHINQQQDRIEQLEKGHQEAAKQITSWFRIAKQNIAEREKDIAELDAARQRIAELEEAEQQLCAANVTLDARAELAERQLAELESRTVTVKLPEVRITVAESRRRNMTWRELGAYNEGADVAAERIGKVLTAQGIKWEAE
ncbi:hypothetical protein [Klebsiella aerogenes]|uniref:hypothetical protein n=1 Tax=Klebsiella aerogenes TaxID=548 RepID=UPI0027856E5F|nr:hypothetical protein [Klebsiella aerogenes]